jgi:hypothetical protein
VSPRYTASRRSIKGLTSAVSPSVNTILNSRHPAIGRFTNSLVTIICPFARNRQEIAPRLGLTSFDGTMDERSGAHVHPSGGACGIIHSPGANQGQRIVAEFEAIPPHSEVASAALVLGPEAQV